MTPEETRAYGRGYQAAGKRWPLHKPPEPPNRLVARLLLALKNLRDEADCYLSTIDPDDELQATLGAKVDDADAVIEELSEWVIDAEPVLVSDASRWLVQRRALARKASAKYYKANREAIAAKKRAEYWRLKKLALCAPEDQHSSDENEK